MGAFYLFPYANTLVIDAGTAITYDIVNKKGQYEGGNISPGIDLRFRALHQFTGRLPLVEKRNFQKLFGKTTVEAILAGVQHGAIYEVEGAIDRFKNSYKNLNVIITGGDAYFFDKKLKNSFFVRSNLKMCIRDSYMIGGVRTNLNAETNIPGLFVCGEAASTGAMGANRLASNSLLECLAFGKRASDSAGKLNHPQEDIDVYKRQLYRWRSPAHCSLLSLIHI